MRNWLLIAAVVLLLDQLSKGWVQAVLAPGDHRSLTAFFDLVLFYNAGAAFSFLADAGGWQRVFFSVFALIASVIIVRLLRKHADQRLFCLALSLVLGGALGNLWDRVLLGHVVDFLYFHYHAYYWPAFNIADTAISIGVALLLLDGLKNRPEKN